MTLRTKTLTAVAALTLGAAAWAQDTTVTVPLPDDITPAQAADAVADAAAEAAEAVGDAAGDAAADAANAAADAAAEAAEAVAPAAEEPAAEEPAAEAAPAEEAAAEEPAAEEAPAEAAEEAPTVAEETAEQPDTTAEEEPAAESEASDTPAETETPAEGAQADAENTEAEAETADAEPAVETSEVAEPAAEESAEPEASAEEAEPAAEAEAGAADETSSDAEMTEEAAADAEATEEPAAEEAEVPAEAEAAEGEAATEEAATDEAAGSEEDAAAETEEDAVEGEEDASEDEVHIEDINFSFEGPFGRFDQFQLQRGLQVYTEVCSACHGLKQVPIRTLHDEGGPGLPEDQVRAYAANLFIIDEETGEERPRLPTDHFPEVEQVAGMGPDLSLMAKGRAGFHGPYGTGISQLFRGIGGPEYIHAVLTGYNGEEMEQAGSILYHNDAFSGNWISMPQPLFEDQVTYEDGTPATVDQMARDVSAFLMWTAEPKMMARKENGFVAVIFLVILAALLYLTNKRLWWSVKHGDK